MPTADPVVPTTTTNDPPLAPTASIAPPPGLNQMGKVVEPITIETNVPAPLSRPAAGPSAPPGFVAPMDPGAGDRAKLDGQRHLSARVRDKI